ncbi:hypothetical protein [Halosolutus gelatinilyticus]|uniref:hypothetical protein n=1 Tax=Halosolutus gelatinilyticus TaxID=2931975 RepID=UPI001FF43791|nr:hypothetical protein [Halosolutus gelatinilyticus]
MVSSRPRSRAGTNADDGFGLGADDRSIVATGAASLVPAALARRAVAVAIGTDRDRYERGEPVEITVDFKNRLPVPIEIPTPRQRRWGWTIDGELKATDERRYTRPRPSAFRFRAGERKRVAFTWHGRLERARGGTRRESVLPDPGEYEIRAFVATHERRYRASDSTTIEIE